MDKYILRVSAGPGYDEATHVEVPVNRPEPVRITSDTAIIELSVRIRDYAGLPRSSEPMSPYFSTEPHAYNQDQYSISFRFTPLRPSPSSASASASASSSSSSSSSSSTLSPSAQSRRSVNNHSPARGIRATDLLFGNDFDRPIRDRLPPGVNTAMGIVKWWIDPGLDGDIYADRPYIFGPALSSFNVISVGGGLYDEAKGGLWFEEGGDKEGMGFRAAVGAPADSKARMKWALRQTSKESWVWQYDKTYGVDFFNPYLDFANLALKLPGFRIPALKYLERHRPGHAPRRSHHLRYVLRHKTSGDVYLAVVFSLVLREDVDEDGVWREKSDGSSSISSIDTGTTPPEEVEVDVDVDVNVHGDEDGDDDEDDDDIRPKAKEEIDGDVGLIQVMKDLHADDEKQETSIADVD